jgi:2-phospho-L-lactate guanylyltransferase
MKHPSFVVLVPVKPPAVGKSRLQVPDHLRPGLAAAFALDAVAAAHRAPGVVEVVVVTGDAGFAAQCRTAGIATEPDTDGLNASLVSAARSVRRRLPDAVPVALCADLPCLLPEDLGTALDQVEAGGAWFVADAEGEGTTTYAAPYDDFGPRFGAGSRAAHLAGGAREVVGALDSLRRDVDDEAALSAALRIGVGAHTADAVALLP